MKRGICKTLKLGIVCLACIAVGWIQAAAAQTRQQTLDCTTFTHTMISSAEGWYWEHRSKTLTLINANIQPRQEWKIVDGQIVEDPDVNGIILPAGSTIVLMGNNRVTARGNRIFSPGTVSFVAKTVLVPNDLERMDNTAAGTLEVTGEKSAFSVKGFRNEGTLTRGENWYTAVKAAEPGSTHYACVDTPPQIIIDISRAAVELESDGFYLYQNEVYSPKYEAGGSYTVTGSTNVGSRYIKVRSGENVRITLENVTVDQSKNRWKSALILETGARAEVILKGENTLHAGTTRAALEVAEGASLEISKDSTGGLTAIGGAGGAGIGGASGMTCGSVLVQGGTIDASGSGGGAGIGQGESGKGGRFEIYGGSLKLAGSYGAAALGGGSNGSGGSVNISGGTLLAQGGAKAPGVGGGANGTDFLTTISGGTLASIGGNGASGIGAGAGASGCSASISGGAVQAGGGYGAAGLSGGTPADSTRKANTLTLSGGSIAAAAGGGSASAVGQDVAGAALAAAINEIVIPPFSIPKDTSAQTYVSYLDSLPTEDDVREQAGDGNQPDDPDNPNPDNPGEADDNAGQAAKRFDDLELDAWYIPALDFAAARQLMDAADGGRSFAPDASATRMVVVEALWRLAGDEQSRSTDRYSDVTDALPYMAAIAWADEIGIIKGDGNGLFRPKAEIAREELCMILAQFAAWRGDRLEVTLQGNFDDADAVSSWAREAVYLCRGSGLVNGRGDGKFYPKDSVTRAEVAQMLYELENLHTVQEENK